MHARSAASEWGFIVQNIHPRRNPLALARKRNLITRGTGSVVNIYVRCPAVARVTAGHSDSTAGHAGGPGTEGQQPGDRPRLPGGLARAGRRLPAEREKAEPPAPPGVNVRASADRRSASGKNNASVLSTRRSARAGRRTAVERPCPVRPESADSPARPGRSAELAR